MSRKHIVASDSSGNNTVLRGDGAHIDRQVAQVRASGRSATVLTDDERIDMAQMTAALIKQHPDLAR